MKRKRKFKQASGIKRGWAAFIKEVSWELMLFPAQAVLSWSGSKRG